MEEGRLDLSELAPDLDEHRWESVVLQTAERGWQARRAQISVTRLVTRWAVPWIGLTAAAAAAVWMMALGSATPYGAGMTAENVDPAFQVAAWARDGEVPSTGEVLTVLEDLDGAN